MPNSHFVRRVLKALEDVTVKIDYKTRNPRLNGKPVRAIFEEDTQTVTLYRHGHAYYADMVVSLLHEVWHNLPINGKDTPEYLVDEVIDRAAFTSPRLRWAASEKIGTVVFKF